MLRAPRRHALALTLLAAAALPLRAGGAAERAVLIVDPANPESLYVANYYQAARGLPGANVVYLAPGASDYQELAAVNVEGFLGELANRRLEDHADYVVLPSGGSFYLPAPGLVRDGCFTVNRFAAPTGYALAHLRATILAGTFSSTPNRYAANTYTPHWFDGTVAWRAGEPSTDPVATRYLVPAMLGYTGLRGNTLEEVLAMIDRSVAVDGTHPAGTFYYMETSDPNRSGPRDPWYPGAVSQMASAGGSAQHLFGNLPTGQHDCLGIMTGLATPAIDGGDFTLLPGAFADHLTSFAATFDTSAQTKMSRWIAKGASGTSGTVEEPCNYRQKFPHARMHVLYFKGLSLGEAWLRSLDWVPYQQLFLGDPLTSPWADFPTVDVPAAPAGPVAGSITLTASAVATAAGAAIARLDLLVDGVRFQSVLAGQSFALDTTQLADGWHELRVLAYDDTLVRNVGRWIGALEVSNDGLAATLDVATTTGDLATRFDCDVAATGGTLRELRLVQNGRVVAATASASATLSVFGQNVGAGPVTLQAEALFTGGGRARSAPVTLDVAYAPGTPAADAPVAFDHEKEAFADRAFVVELPAAYADDPATASYAIVTPPAQATVLSRGDGPWRVLSPAPGASGTDTLAFQVTTPAGVSAVGTVTIVYSACNVVARSDFRNAGTNPASYAATPPVIGGVFTATVELATTGHAQATILGYAAPATLPLANGATVLVDVTHPAGELFGIPFAGGPTAVFTFALPNDPALCGVQVATQALHVGGVQPFRLSNAQDLTAGVR